MIYLCLESYKRLIYLIEREGEHGIRRRKQFFHKHIGIRGWSIPRGKENSEFSTHLLILMLPIYRWGGATSFLLLLFLLLFFTSSNIEESKNFPNEMSDKWLFRCTSIYQHYSCWAAPPPSFSSAEQLSLNELFRIPFKMCINTKALMRFHYYLNLHFELFWPSNFEYGSILIRAFAT